MFPPFLNLIVLFYLHAQSQVEVTEEALPDNPKPMDDDKATKPSSTERYPEPEMVSEKHHSENPTAEVSIFTYIIDILNDILSWETS